jgi:hypothetical protein
MITAPRGRIIGKRVGGEPANEAEHFIRCPACAAGSTAATWAKCWSMRGRCLIPHMTRRSDLTPCAIRPYVSES